MSTEQIRKMAEEIRRHRREHSSLEAARDAYRLSLESAFGEALSDVQLSRVEQAFLIVKQEEETEVEILRRSSMFQPRPDWYHGPRATDRHWHALSAYLMNTKGWPEKTVQETIGEASTEIVSLLENPKKESFSCRGLVIGHVQSGKTANMTAVIAKAVDAGYNFVILLAGLTNKLRQQTQRRLEADVVNRYRNLWHLMTTDDDKGDFRGLANGGFFVPPAPAVQIAVVKKNVAPLKRLIRAVDKTPQDSLRRMKVLIIDDEADQGSVNSASKEFDMTRINALIRELINALPSFAYVGYTATPFANVFINPHDRNGNLDDLYPKDFITALKKPDGYFGAEQLFGREPQDPSAPLPAEEGLDVIREVPEGEAELLQPQRRADKDGFQPQLVGTLEKAVLYFLACCAARRVRGQSDQHMSMLIHTSSFIVMHDKVAGLIENWLSENRKDLLTPGSSLNQKLRGAWESEANKLPAEITTESPVPFDELEPRLEEVLDHLKVVIENGASDDRIDYSGPPKTYIVVGGSVLARGLTLEGLMVSYFLRSSSQYDTLLQMGRWFGYRGGYEDLPRIWMTADLERSFRALASIEQEIREDVAQYASRKISPMEFAVRVRSIPGLAITAASKMRHAVECDISYSGLHVQSIEFAHRNETITKANWDGASELVSKAMSDGYRADDADRILFLDVPRNLIVQFLRKFHIETSRNDLKTDFLRGYINRDDVGLESWNVAVVTASETQLSERELGSLGKIKPVRRSKLKPKPDCAPDIDIPANIKGLMSRQDVMVDCPGVAFDRGAKWSALKDLRKQHLGDKPLLLLYPIDRVSEPKPGNDKRVALDAIGDQIGIGIVFPGATSGSGGYYHVDLNPPDTQDLDDLDAEISEMEAKGLVD